MNRIFIQKCFRNVAEKLLCFFNNRVLLSAPLDCSSTGLSTHSCFLWFHVCLEAASSEVEVLQVYGAQCACEQVEVLLGEIHRAVQGALQAGGQAGVPGEEGQVGERRR